MKLLSYSFILICCGTDLLAGIIGSVDITGKSLFATGGDVTAYFVGQSASYTDFLTLSSPSNTLGTIFVNHTATPGQSVDLGSFAAGTELIFAMTVQNTGYQFFTGPASRNPDNAVHGAVATWQADALIPANGVYVGFEDLYNGPFNYNDLDFVFAGTTTNSPINPEPSTYALMVGGGLFAFLLKRKARYAYLPSVARRSKE